MGQELPGRVTGAITTRNGTPEIQNNLKIRPNLLHSQITSTVPLPIRRGVCSWAWWPADTRTGSGGRVVSGGMPGAIAARRRTLELLRGHVVERAGQTGQSEKEKESERES